MPDVNEQKQQVGAAAGNGGKPVVPQQQYPVSTQAHWTAEDIEKIADEADALARLYRAECQRIAADYRKVTREYLNRLIQLKQQ